MKTEINVGRGVGGGWRFGFTRATLAVLCLAASQGVRAGWVDFAAAQVIVGNTRLPDPETLLAPSDVVLDPATGKVFVVDSGYHRVLRWDNAAARTNGAPANGVFGRTSMAADAGYPDSVAAGFNSISGLQADDQGRLWAVDSREERVLRWDQAASKTNGAPATGVIGQTSPTSLIRFENANQLSDSAPASGVLGAQSLVTYISGGRTLEQFWRPFSIFLDVSESIWVGDYANHRLLRFTPDTVATVTESGPSDGQYQMKFSVSRKGRFEVQSSTDLRSWAVEKGYDLSSGMEQVFEKPMAGEVRFFRVFEP